jgi:hypothetical protein
LLGLWGRVPRSVTGLVLNSTVGWLLATAI